MPRRNHNSMHCPFVNDCGSQLQTALTAAFQGHPNRQPPRPNCRPKSRFHFAFISPPQFLLSATADLFSAAALTFSAAALTFSAAADPTPRVRGTLHFAPAAASIRPNCHPSPDIPPSIVSLFFVSLCGHRTDAFGHTGDLVCSFQQSRSPLLLTSFPSSVKRSRAVCVASRRALCSDADPTMKRDT